MRSLLLAACCLAGAVSTATALPPTSTSLTSLTVSATTGEKPQSKVWTHAGRWWCVMPNSSGTWVWRLDGTSWTNVLQLSASTAVHADVKAIGGVSHVLLFNGASSQLASIEYVPATQTYQAWSARPGNVSLPLDGSTETATLDVDSQGRMWLATDYAAGASQIVVYSSDAPYGTWSGPVTLAGGIGSDDISVVTAMPGGKIGVLWSNQSAGTQRFGFRVHLDGADPATWSADEVPASQSALPVGLGMADDHLHVAVAADGTLYAAVKTSYDTAGYPKVALLVRRPAGTWDDLYGVSETGTRGIVLLDESAGTVTVIYTSTEGAGDILYKETPTSSIAFGASATLIPGSINDATSTKANVSGSVVILAGSGSSLVGVRRSSGALGLVGWWKMDGDVTDASGNGFHATAAGAPGYVAGPVGQALDLNGTSQYAFVPDAPALRAPTNALTLATWIRPTQEGTQNLISKSTNGGVGGYELCLAATSSTWPHKAFFRLNQVPSGDTYRINSTTLYSDHLDSWIHLAATYDGATMKLYVNGVLESSLAAALTINPNTLPLGIGAQVDAGNVGTRFFRGAMDDVRVYDQALSAAEIAALANQTIHTITASAGSGGSISPSGAVMVGQGANQAFIITANGGYHIADVLVDAVSVGAVASYTFTDVQADHTIAASFAPDAPGSDLVGRWMMEEGGGATIFDATSYHNDGALSGAPAWAAGVSGQALVLNGTSQYALVPHSASLDATTAITIAAWVKPGKLGTANVVAKANFASPLTPGYELNLSSTGKPFVRFNVSDTYRVNGLTSYPTDGSTWMHLAATYDGSQIKLYVNGALDNSLSSTFTIQTNTGPLGIGAQNDGNTGRLFKGAIDDVRVYTRALSAGEIAGLYTLVGVGEPPALTRFAPAMPTPFGSRTTLEFSLAARGVVELAVFGIDGRRVRTLVTGMREAGVHRVGWDGRDEQGQRLPAGVFFARLTAGGEQLSRTLVRLAR